MSYKEFKPHIALEPYIDSYWVVKTNTMSGSVERLLPDGCIDLIYNSGNDYSLENGDKLKNETLYISGTMTRYKDLIQQNDTHLLGIRFKPLGFSAFYNHTILNEIANKTIEFDKNALSEIHKIHRDPVNHLDSFFLNRLNAKQNLISAILTSIKNSNGNINVSVLSKKHFTTEKQLERNFKLHLGIPPKEYINFIRYQVALEKIKQNSTNRSLLDIAFETGFYDHSHLANEIKKHSGLTPSQLK